MKFTIRENAEPSPSGPQHISMYLNSKWYGLSWTHINFQHNQENNSVSDLDVKILQDKLLNPILNIKNPRTDQRIQFIGGSRGTGELTKLVDSGKAAVAFSMYPVAIEQIMAVADDNQIMPPKSTWFKPKPRSGLLVHTL